MQLPSRCSRACPPAGNFSGPSDRAPTASTTIELTVLAHSCAGLPHRRTLHCVRPRETIVVSKRTRGRDITFGLFDSEFEQALEETEHRQRNRGRRIEQKTRQLCRQVQRALNLALVGQFADGKLDGALVVEVSAVAGCGRLVAHIAVPSGHVVSAVLEALRERTPQLRAIVAGYISRKRAPELSFMVVPFGSDAHE